MDYAYRLQGGAIEFKIFLQGRIFAKEFKNLNLRSLYIKSRRQPRNEIRFQIASRLHQESAHNRTRSRAQLNSTPQALLVKEGEHRATEAQRGPDRRDVLRLRREVEVRIDRHDRG